MTTRKIFYAQPVRSASVGTELSGGRLSEDGKGREREDSINLMMDNDDDDRRAQ